jgi:hypothetical protein
MRFKFLMPVVQTAAMLLILWAPRNPRAHEVDTQLARTPRAIEWAEGINLPASAVVTPAEFAMRKHESLPNMKVRFYGFWLVGLLCWYMVGRFIDDLIRWRRARKLPRKNAGDLAFALIAAPSAALLGIAFNEGNIQSSVLAAWGVIWIAIASAALLFRVAQAIQQRRRPAVH